MIINKKELKKFIAAILREAAAHKTILPDGTETWYNDAGQRHREDGPALIMPDGSKAWYKNGEFHREDGPAVVWPHNGTVAWYWNGDFWGQGNSPWEGFPGTVSGVASAGNKDPVLSEFDVVVQVRSGMKSSYKKLQQAFELVKGKDLYWNDFAGEMIGTIMARDPDAAKLRAKEALDKINAMEFVSKISVR